MTVFGHVPKQIRRSSGSVLQIHPNTGVSWSSPLSLDPLSRFKSFEDRLLSIRTMRTTPITAHTTRATTMAMATSQHGVDGYPLPLRRWASHRPGSGVSWRGLLQHGTPVVYPAVPKPPSGSLVPCSFGKVDCVCWSFVCLLAWATQMITSRLLMSCRN